MISFGGLASGLDTQAIINAMLSVERVPINLLQVQRDQEKEKLSLVGTFKGLVETLKSSADALRTNDKFFNFKVTSSDDSAATFSAGAGSVAGSHNMTVQSLAQADRWAFDGVLDPATDLASVDGEQLDFTVNGTSYSIALTAADSSLNEIASQVNSLAGEDVTASVVNVGTASAPSYQMVITAEDTGEDYRVTGISSTITGLSIDGTGPDGAGASQSANNVTVGTNAVALIDGLLVERTTNDFNGVVPGVDIALQAASLNTPISFTVAADSEAVKEKVQSFVDAFNGVVEFVNTQNSFSEDDGPGGELFGDSIMRSVRSGMTSSLFNVPTADVLADTLGYSTLSLIGIKTTNEGTLSLDSTIFDEKFSDNMDAVADLFIDNDGFDNGGAAEGTFEFYVDTTADAGLADNLFRTLDLMTGSIPDGDGGSVKALFDSRNEALQKKIDDIEDTIESKQRYLEIFEANLVTQFAALEGLMGGLNAQGAALSNGLASLQNF
jgi:flagellar hook-associated protein 2